MSEVFTPETAVQVRDVMEWALSGQQPLAISGTDSRAAMGRPVQAAHRLDLSHLSGIILYEPEELVLTVRAGTSLDEIEALLAEHDQHLACEAVSLGRLLDPAAGRGTIGGLYGCNLAGPRRIRDGAVRDQVLGVKGVSGRGEMFKSGGRVVKNVTGYDLSKGLCGAWGTLSVVTELSLKVMPKPEHQDSVVLVGLSEADAVAAMSAALGSSAEVSAAAHLPAGVARRTGVEVLSGFHASVTALRLEGIQPSIDYRAETLSRVLKPFGRAERLGEEVSGALWLATRDVIPFAETRERLLWRLSVTPSRAPSIAEAIRAAGEASLLFDWGGGLIWVELPAEEAAGDGRAAVIRKAVAEHGGGHATLVRAPAPLRTVVPPFQPQEPGLAALSARVKAQFDPDGILNPGRMVAGV